MQCFANFAAIFYSFNKTERNTKKSTLCYFLKTYTTIGKTDICEGVKRQNEGLSVSFDKKYEQYKQIVGLTKTFDNRK